MIADARYLESMWHQYRRQPVDVPADWRNAFHFIELIFGSSLESVLSNGRDTSSSAAPVHDTEPMRQYLRSFGHLHADLDPLSISVPGPLPESIVQAIDVGRLNAHPYLGTTAIETGHLDDPEMVNWVALTFEQLQLEPTGPTSAIYRQLIETEVFDQFLAAKFTGKKRFGSEGADAILPLLHALRDEAASVGVDEMVLGSMHRGRLSILANFLGKDPSVLLAEISGEHPFPARPDVPADMPYHLGHIDERAGVRTTLLPNPSHLEAVNPVAVGFTRARREMGSGRAMALLLHTDASIVGQGVNAELLQMSGLKGFETGGTIHVVINNQIGFTTDPSDARTSRYCTGPWRAINSLIVHVNGDDVDAVARSARLAVLFRERYRRDAIIDLVCYRANGHNEIDEPRFTQPLYYKIADTKRSVAAVYEQRMIDAGSLSPPEAAEQRAAIRKNLDEAFAARKVNDDVPLLSNQPKVLSRLSEKSLAKIIDKLSAIPAERANQKMIKLMERRREEQETGISWALAESLAFACALNAGISVRFCGQDVERGPFSQRHLAGIHPQTGERYYALSSCSVEGATFEVVNSLLAEYAVLGFEYGYSLGAPGSLNIWEAQFGDFANGAQVIIDQFVVSGSEKWRQASNLTIFLPHGLEGQGPEHSSARIERLLQLCARNNITVAHPTTPANFFHLLVGQAEKGCAPLFIVTPKVLLRLPQARSKLSDFADDAGFLPVIASESPTAVRAVICSGKLYYELEKLRAAERCDVMLIRLERLYPFPSEQLVSTLRGTTVKNLTWVQEEPENVGAGPWLLPKLNLVAAELGLELNPMLARSESASPAGSFHNRHERDQDALVRRALGLGENNAN